MKNFIVPVIAALSLSASSISAEETPKMICKDDVCTLPTTAQSIQETRKKVSELVHNDAVTMKNFDLFAKSVEEAFQKEKSITESQVQEICAGVEFAAEKHKLQTRKNKEKTPYVSHPIGVATNLMTVGGVRDAAVIIGALLHDTVEDTQTTFEEIEGKFGKKVAGYVREVTDDKSLAKEVRKRQQVINAAHKSEGAAQIKLADKLYNLNDLFNNPPSEWTQARIDLYYEWAQSVIDRLPKANDKLHAAAVAVIDQYWEKQSAKK